MNEWISVKERLPEGADGKSLCENVIAFTVAGEVVPGWLNGDVWYLLIGGNDLHTKWRMGYVTHWMPLPEPPKEG